MGIDGENKKQAFCASEELGTKASFEEEGTEALRGVFTSMRDPDDTMEEADEASFQQMIFEDARIRGKHKRNTSFGGDEEASSSMTTRQSLRTRRMTTQGSIRSQSIPPND